MFRTMRRFKQQLPDAETEQILAEGKTGVLGVIGDDGYPYTVPMNYLYKDGKIVFHGAKQGHKYDAMKNCDKVSFTVIAVDEVIPELVTNRYKSVIAFGRVKAVEDMDEALELARSLGLKFSPADAVEADIKNTFRNMVVYVMTVEYKTGKEGLEFTKERAK